MKQKFLQGFVDKYEALKAKVFGKNVLTDILPDDDTEEPCNPLSGDCELSVPEVDTSDPGADEEPLFEFGESDESEEFEVSWDTDELDNTPEDPENQVDIANMLGEEAPDEDDELEMSFEVEGPPKPPNPFCEARQWIAAAM